MKFVDPLAEKIRRDEPISPPLSAVLSAASYLTRLGMAWRLARPRVRVKAHVISIGNITAGGTGKTPVVIERARAETAAGRRVAVLTRGYGSGARDSILVADGAMPRSVVAAAFGDEPALILSRAPEAILVKCADRVAGARAAIERDGCDVLILDDGFQYVRLERDENIVLVDATNPFGNRCLIPRGILREPLTALARATQIVLTRCDQVESLEPLLVELRDLAPGIPVRKTVHAPTGLWCVASGEAVCLDSIAGVEIDAACAIGNPEAFMRTLEQLGALVVGRHVYRDHHSFEPRAIVSDRPLIVTEKDAVRFVDAPENVYALAIELRDMPEGSK